MNQNKMDSSNLHQSGQDKKEEANNASKDVKEDDVKLNDFLELMTMSCQLNDVIHDNANRPSSANAENTVQPKKELDYGKLAGNPLINKLFGFRKKETAESKCENEPLGSLPLAKNDGGFVPKTYVPIKTETNARAVGLHPKLHIKLDFVTNEGIVDSVLPFICPVPVPQIYIQRQLAKQKTQTKPSVDANQSVGNESGTNSSNSNSTAPMEMNTIRRTTLVCGANGQPVKQSEVDKINHGHYRRKSLLCSRGARENKEPEVVIHVCDEMKNSSKDFCCPQSLLVTKMGYFADVTAVQNLEDMDISVHCDIQIFDWLMKWVKQSDNMEMGSSTAIPQLDAINVVPILVSASFLKMEPLLLDCLSFCHSNLNEIVRLSSNLACLNDSIITRLAAMFTNVELEMVKDKKDRLTPRLWIKLIQSLCEPEPEALRGHFYSLAGLFQCTKCGKYLTHTMKSYIRCVPSNTNLSYWGQAVSHHVRNPHWDINAYILQLFKDLNSWRKVYWKLWGHCHFLYCSICEAHFPAYQMTWCRFHPENPNFLGLVSEGSGVGSTGRYACCGQQAFRFDTMPGPNGCQFQEHSIVTESDRERSILSIAQLAADNFALCENPPAKLQELVCRDDIGAHWMNMPLVPKRFRQGLLPPLNPDESEAKSRRTRQAAYFIDFSNDSSSSEETAHIVNPRKKLPNKLSNDDSDSSSDGCESEMYISKSSNKVIKRKQVHIPGRFWSGEVSARSNQDHQREFEEKVMKQVIAIVNKKTGSDHSLPHNSTPLGGIYIRLEAEWKEQLKQRQANNAAPYQSNVTVNQKQRNK